MGRGGGGRCGRCAREFGYSLTCWRGLRGGYGFGDGGVGGFTGPSSPFFSSYLPFLHSGVIDAGLRLLN